jgi:hypothetical protein
MSPTSATISADGLSFVPIRGRALSHGYYVGRRRTWAADAAWHLVFVYALEDETGTTLGVFQAGSDRPDDPAQWVFRSRVVGLEHLPAILPPHPRVALATIAH